MTKTMTAEEVAKVTKRLSEILEAHGLVKDHAESAQNLVTVLAAQAARVQGLEAQLATAYRPPTLKEVFGSLDGFLAHARSAAGFHGNKEMAKASLLELVVKHIPEADMHTAVGNVELLSAEGPEASALRERVATLEGEVAKATEYAAGRDVIVEAWSDALGLERADGYDAAERIREARDTAEARVKELQTQVAGHLQAEEYVRPALRAAVAYACIAPATGSREHLRAEAHRTALNVLARFALVPGADERVNQDDAPLASQPPPATAQGVDEDVMKVRDALDVFYQRSEAQYKKDRVRWSDAVEALERIAARLTPTPPPGLREAAEGVSIARQLRRVADATKEPRVVVVDQSKATELVRLLDVARAAYDATGGEHGPDSTCPNCKADHEEAAKYRAAVARLDDRAGQVKAAHEAWGSDPEGAVARWVLYGEGENDGGPND